MLSLPVLPLPVLPLPVLSLPVLSLPVLPLPVLPLPVLSLPVLPSLLLPFNPMLLLSDLRLSPETLLLSDYRCYCPTRPSFLPTSLPSRQLPEPNSLFFSPCFLLLARSTDLMSLFSPLLIDWPAVPFPCCPESTGLRSPTATGPSRR